MIAYETIDVSVKNKFSIVIRYIYENEFLLKVSRLLTAKYRVNADGIAEIILIELAKILQRYKNEVVAQIYDGAPVMKDIRGSS